MSAAAGFGAPDHQAHNLKVAGLRSPEGLRFKIAGWREACHATDDWRALPRELW